MLYFVASTRQFKVCLGEQGWQDISINGPQGETGAKGDSGPAGATGPQGALGPQGPAGPPSQATEGMNSLLIKASWSDASTYTDGSIVLNSPITVKLPPLINIDRGWSKGTGTSATITFGPITCSYSGPDVDAIEFNQNTKFSNQIRLKPYLYNRMNSYKFNSCDSGSYEPDNNPNISLSASNAISLHIDNAIVPLGGSPMRAKVLIEIATFD